jgi:hypothetical protein
MRAGRDDEARRLVRDAVQELREELRLLLAVRLGGEVLTELFASEERWTVVDDEAPTVPFPSGGNNGAAGR